MSPANILPTPGRFPRLLLPVATLGGPTPPARPTDLVGIGVIEVVLFRGNNPTTPQVTVI